MKEHCHCNYHDETYKIIENYRSILNRKRQLISSWKIFDNNGKITFSYGTKFRKNADALVIRSKYTCLINPWYKYIGESNYLLSMLRQNRHCKVYEIVLLECTCATSLHEYELAVIQCSCFEQMRSYCAYCQLILVATEQSDILLCPQSLKNVTQQTDVTFSSDSCNNEDNMDGNFYNRLGLYQYQRTVQIQVEVR